jgi:hypothetical protein
MLTAAMAFTLPRHGHIEGRTDLAQYGFLGKVKSTDAYMYRDEAIDADGNIRDTADWTIHTTTSFDRKGFMTELLAQNVIHSANLVLSNSYFYLRDSEKVTGLHIGNDATLMDSIYIHYPDSFTVIVLHVNLKDSSRLEFCSNLDRKFRETGGYHKKTKGDELLELSYYTSKRDEKGRLQSMTTRDSLLHQTTVLQYEKQLLDREGNATLTLIRNGITGKIEKVYRRTYQYWE